MSFFSCKGAAPSECCRVADITARLVNKMRPLQILSLCLAELVYWNSFFECWQLDTEETRHASRARGGAIGCVQLCFVGEQNLHASLGRTDTTLAPVQYPENAMAFGCCDANSSVGVGTVAKRRAKENGTSLFFYIGLLAIVSQWYLETPRMESRVVSGIGQAKGGERSRLLERGSSWPCPILAHGDHAAPLGASSRAARVVGQSPRPIAYRTLKLTTYGISLPTLKLGAHPPLSVNLHRSSVAIIILIYSGHLSWNPLASPGQSLRILAPTKHHKAN